MNDPSKRISVNISSLLSLKAELLRKQDEVNKAKEKQKAEVFVPKKGSSKPDKLEESDEISTEKHFEEYEDSDLLNRSRKVLESKAKFYDRMTAMGGKVNSDDNCLVLFNQKKQENRPEKDSSSEYSDDDNDDKYSSKNPDEQWVEYTDCLGRTRKCLKKDLDFFKRKDNKLAENIQPRVELNQNAPMWMIDTKGSNSNDKPEIRDDVSEMTSIMSKHDQMKVNWEKKEEENVHKENVHYQDVLFDEARTHGVGYYAFSTDEEERAKQRKALDEMRDRTLEEQKDREALRGYRENTIAKIVKDAKNRQRTRLGLPPLEDEPEPEKQLFDTKEEEKRKKREEKERRKKEKEEKRKEEERKRHIRPWDRNKDGVPATADSGSSSDEWNYKPEREPMSQEQWNEHKRKERNPEFAPVLEEPTRRSFRAQPSFQMSSPDDDPKEHLYFTTRKSPKKRQFIRKNYSNIENESGVPIRNELEEDSQDGEPSNKRCRGVEIPPPPTFEYYGPPSSKHSKAPPNSNLEQSIEAGLKYIREQSDKGILPTKSSWSANADY